MYPRCGLCFSRSIRPAHDLIFLQGLEDPKKSKVLLGKFQYQLDSHPIQTFPIKSCSTPFEFIEFHVDSNHGSPDYTCIYRWVFFLFSILLDLIVELSLLRYILITNFRDVSRYLNPSIKKPWILTAIRNIIQVC